MRTGSLAPALTRLAVLLLALSAFGFGVDRFGGPGVNAAIAAYEDWRRPDPVAMPIPEPGTRTVEEAVVGAVVFDSSSSMFENDPSNERAAALLSYGKWLSDNGRSRDRFGVVRFAGTATSSNSILRARQLTRGIDQLAAQPIGGPRGTFLLPAVMETEKIFAVAPKKSRKTVLILTDGEVPDATEGIARLRRVADYIEVVALDRDDTWDAAQSSWKAPGVRLTEARNKRPNELGAELAKSFMRSTGEKPKS